MARNRYKIRTIQKFPFLFLPCNIQYIIDMMRHFYENTKLKLVGVFIITFQG